MATRKRQLVNGVSVKVENRSGFDKSRFNALTTGVGTITPIVKQRLIPNSDGSCRIKISAQLPPLASDCYLRTHLKLEAFFCPDRLCFGGYESFFCGREIYDSVSGTWKRAKLPRLGLVTKQIDFTDYVNNANVNIEGDTFSSSEYYVNSRTSAGSLIDYLGISAPVGEPTSSESPSPGSKAVDESDVLVKTPKSTAFSDCSFGFYASDDLSKADGVVSVNARVYFFNIFPIMMYGLIYDEYYRNKLVERPLFSPPAGKMNTFGEVEQTDLRIYNLPFISTGDGIITYLDLVSKDILDETSYANLAISGLDGYGSTDLLNGNLLDLRQRNYGDDYFTAAMPSAQEGNPVTVAVADNQFSIAALRMSNALQEFAEVNGYASPDYVQTLSARYGSSLSYGVAQKPVFLGSADIPMYTSGVEQTAQSGSQSVNTPFNTVGARYGRAHAEGTEFVCKFHADEPGYFFVFATLVPEAQYFQGVDKDMMTFVEDGCLTDIPCGLLEHVGNEAISVLELNSEAADPSAVFGYVQRYLWHKLGHQNEVHSLFRKDKSLGSFVVQRELGDSPQISTDFLKVKKKDLDNVAAVSAGISQFGVMIDSFVDLKVSEPLAESALPSLSNPAREHGRSVYVKTGGSKLA